MATIQMKFPDGNVKEFEQGTTGEAIAQSISPGLKKQALAVKLDGEPYDLRRPINQDGSIEILTYKNQEGIEIMRHFHSSLDGAGDQAHLWGCEVRCRPCD